MGERSLSIIIHAYVKRILLQLIIIHMLICVKDPLNHYD